MEAAGYKEENNLTSYLLWVFIIFNFLDLRLYEHRVLSTNLVYIEPFYPVLFVVLVIYGVYKKVEFFKFPLSRYYFLYLLIGIWAVFWGIANGNALSDVFGQFRRYLFYPLILIFAYIFSGPRPIKYLLSTFKVFLIILIPYSILSYMMGMNLEIHGYFQFIHHFEGWVVSFFIYLYVSYTIINKASSLNKYLPHALISLLFVILTARRGVWFSITIGIFLAAIMSLKKITFKQLYKPILISVTISLILLVIFFLGGVEKNTLVYQTVVDRFQSTIVNIENPTVPTQGGSLAWRYAIYLQGISYFVAKPIFGYGLGFNPPPFKIPMLGGNLLFADVRFHNAYLEILILMGLVGLTIFILFHLKFVHYVSSQIKLFDKDEMHLIIAFFCVYISGMFWAFIDNTFASNPNFIFSLYLIIGILLAETVNKSKNFG